MRTLIVAVDLDNAIGWSDGRLAYRIKEDMQHFRQQTLGKTVVMGYKTFVTLGNKAGLPGRKNVILSSRSREQLDIDDSVDVINSLDQLPGDCCIIGGASVYDQCLEQGLIDVTIVTVIADHSNADVRLKHQLADWQKFISNQLQKGNQWTLVDEIIGKNQSIKFVFVKRVINPSSGE